MRLYTQEFYELFENQIAHSNFSLTTLKTFATSPDDLIREILARNPNTPKEVLIKMLNDKDEKVRLAAKESLDKKIKG